jgi:hypothetical protein
MPLNLGISRVEGIFLVFSRYYKKTKRKSDIIKNRTHTITSSVG